MFKEVLKGFYLCLEISCSHPCLRKIRFEGSKAMDPRLFAIILFYHCFFSRERYTFFFKGYLLLLTKFLLLFSLAKLKQGPAWMYRGILAKYSQCTLRGDLCLLCTLCIFFSFDVHLEPWFTSSMNLASGLPYLFEVFPAGVSP